MTYTQKNILSAFEATGIHPVNERWVINPEEEKKAIAQPTSAPKFKIPVTSAHSWSIILHGCWTLKALPDATPQSKFNKAWLKR